MFIANEHTKVTNQIRITIENLHNKYDEGLITWAEYLEEIVKSTKDAQAGMERIWKAKGEPEIRLNKQLDRLIKRFMRKF